MRRFLPVLLFLSAGTEFSVAASHPGRVLDAAGAPIPHASVIVKDTFEGARTDENGHFDVEWPDDGPATLIIAAEGSDPVERLVSGTESPIEIKLGLTKSGDVEMAPVRVQASSYATGSSAVAALTALEVVTTPGATADINRAIQTLPGVQNVDEGDALFVRGGDYWETGTYINQSFYPSALRLEAPTGTFVGTINPFLTSSIDFASGGFGVRYGNLLSGVVALETQGTPLVPDLTINAGVGALSFGGALPVGERGGIRLSATRLDLSPMMRLNGSSLNLDPAPRGHDLSASAIWEYRPGAELKWFAIEQQNRFGVRIDRPSYSGTYSASRTNRFSVVSWKDSFGRWSPEVSLSLGENRQSEIYGRLGATTRTPTQHFFGATHFTANDAVTLSAGVDADHVGAHVSGRKPVSFDVFGPQAPSTDLSARVHGARAGAFVEADWALNTRWRAVAGGRVDHSSLTGQDTFDPRLSLAYRWRKGVYLTAAGGVYHQIPDAALYNPALGGTGLPSMRATHAIAGLQLGERDRQVRIEVYQKNYDDLAQFDRNRDVVRGGVGRSRGVDFYAKTVLPGAVKARVTVSWLDAARTDPNTGLVARAPFGIRTSTTVILQRSFPHGIEAGISWRMASGKPFTEVAGAHYDPQLLAYVPEYGAPDAGRLPEYQRLDLSFSKLARYRTKYFTVFYLSLSNVLGRANVYDYTYSPDYRVREEVPSIFNRSVYFGVSVIYR